MDDVIVGHGISLLRWRSGGVKHPHDMPPFRFPPSPTFGDSSCAMQESFTDAQARQLARDVRVEADRLNVQNELPAGRPGSEISDLLPEAVLPRAAKAREAATQDQAPKTRVISQLRSAASLAIRVRYQNRAGQLIVDRLA